jgi:hypothetical protein
MISPNNPAVEDILRRVSAEVARRQSPKNLGPTQLGWPQLAARAGLAGVASGAAWAGGQGTAFQPNDAREYPLSAFLALNGPAFVSGCYAGLLGRPPDSEGLAHYLGLLQRGVPKADIVGRFRFSSEGRRFGARVHGLWAPFIFHSIARIPVAGYLFSLCVDIVTLPLLKRRLRRFEDAAFTQGAQNAQALQSLERRIDALESTGTDNVTRGGPR